MYSDELSAGFLDGLAVVRDGVGKWTPGSYTFQLMSICGFSWHKLTPPVALVVKPDRVSEKDMEFQKLLTLDDLAVMLGRSPETIRKDLVRKPWAVPPRLILPSIRMLRWRVVDVNAWLEQFVQTTATKGGVK